MPASGKGLQEGRIWRVSPAPDAAANKGFAAPLKPDATRTPWRVPHVKWRILPYINGGGGSRTLVPWQVEEHFYTLRLQVNVESQAARSLTAHDPSRSCVLTDDRSTLSSGHSAGRQFFAGRGLPTGTGLPFFRQPAEGRSLRLLGT